MNLKVEEGVNAQPEEILKVVDSAKEIVAGVDAGKVDPERSGVYRSTGVRLEVVPADERAMPVYICVRGKDDIVVGIMHGAHEHFNSSHSASEITEKALGFFKSLLHSTQQISLKLKDGKVFSKEILFKLGDELVSEYSDKELLLTVFGSVTSESHEFSFI
ncbi:MAG: hypothetical protein RQ824_05260 [bacterium]|nr:hypothetical protein [bacterium]